MLKLVHAFDMNFSSVKDYYDSFDDKWHDLNCYALYKVRDGLQGYFDYINTYEKNMYYLVDDQNPNYIIGYGSITDSEILDYHLPFLNTGNIGYGIRPSERNKGYGTKLLRLLLLQCEYLGMREVCVSCLKENVSSSRVILKNNGKLEKEFFDDDTGKFGLKYWIKLHPTMTNKIRRYVKQHREQKSCR